MTQEPEPNKEKAFSLHTMDADEVSFLYSTYISYIYSEIGIHCMQTNLIDLPTIPLKTYDESPELKKS